MFSKMESIVNNIVDNPHPDKTTNEHNRILEYVGLLGSVYSFTINAKKVMGH